VAGLEGMLVVKRRAAWRMAGLIKVGDVGRSRGRGTVAVAAAELKEPLPYISRIAQFDAEQLYDAILSATTLQENGSECGISIGRSASIVLSFNGFKYGLEWVEWRAAWRYHWCIH